MVRIRVSNLPPRIEKANPDPCLQSLLRHHHECSLARLALSCNCTWQISWKLGQLVGQPLMHSMGSETLWYSCSFQMFDPDMLGPYILSTLSIYFFDIIGIFVASTSVLLLK